MGFSPFLIVTNMDLLKDIRNALELANEKRPTETVEAYWGWIEFYPSTEIKTIKLKKEFHDILSERFKKTSMEVKEGSKITKLYGVDVVVEEIE